MIKERIPMIIKNIFFHNPGRIYVIKVKTKHQKITKKKVKGLYNSTILCCLYGNLKM